MIPDWRICFSFVYFTKDWRSSPLCGVEASSFTPKSIKFLTILPFQSFGQILDVNKGFLSTALIERQHLAPNGPSNQIAMAVDLVQHNPDISTLILDSESWPIWPVTINGCLIHANLLAV